MRRRRPLDDIGGFAGGTLGEQLDDDTDVDNRQRPRQQMPQQQPQQIDLTATRPRTVANPTSDLSSPPLTPTQGGFQDRLMRLRRVNPRDDVAEDTARVSNLQNAPLSLRDKFGMVSQVIARSLGGEPLPTRRQQKIARSVDQLNRDVTLEGIHQKREAIKSQADAREAAIFPGQDRIRQGDERLKQGDERLQQGTDRLKQGEATSRKRNIASVYNGLPEFDPTDPANAALNAQFQQEFGYAPPKKARGSMLQVIEGVNADGSPHFTVIDKGTGVGKATTGDLPAQTTATATRQQRERLFNKAKTGRNDRAAATQVGANARAAGRTGGGRPDHATTRRIAIRLGDAEANKSALTAKDEEIKNASEVALPRLNKERQTIVDRGKAIATELNTLDPDNETGSGDGGYIYRKPRGGQQVQGSDLDHPIAPNAKPAGRAWDANRFKAAFKNKHGRPPTQAETDAYAAAAQQ